MPTVSFAGAALTIEVSLADPKLSYRIEFAAVVGYQVLDERDLPPFTEATAKVEKAILFEVLSGGWADAVKAQSPIMGAGFYPRLREWFVVTDDWCLSVLSEAEPSVVERLP